MGTCSRGGAVEQGPEAAAPGPLIVPSTSQLNMESTSSDGCETLFSQLQAQNDGWKPCAKDVPGAMGKVEYIAISRMQPYEERGCYTPSDSKEIYGTNTTRSLNSGAADVAGSAPREALDQQLKEESLRIVRASTVYKALRSHFKFK